MNAYTKIVGVNGGPSSGCSILPSADILFYRSKFPIFMLDNRGHVATANRSAIEIFGSNSGVVLGEPWWELVPVHQRVDAQRAVEQCLAGTPREITLAIYEGDDCCHWLKTTLEPVDDSFGGDPQILVILQDITDLNMALVEAQTAATTDSLTGLPNRALFQSALDDCIAHAKSSSTKIGLILLDVDRFKEINDDLGHEAGDQVLKAVARCLRRLPKPAKMAARLGGDEFVIILEGLTDERDAEPILESLMANLHSAVEFSDRSLECSASFGLSIWPDHGANHSELLKASDLALYVAKDLGRGGYANYNPIMQQTVRLRNQVANWVRKKLDGDVMPYYQPQFDLESGAVIGFEALMRIRDETGGVRGPGGIESIFENENLCCRISDIMIRQVAKDMRTWKDMGLEFGRVSLNAAVPELRNKAFAENVLSTLKKAGLPPQMLQIEVLESVFLGRGSETIADAITHLRQAGIRVALDDFGTGFASLKNLKDLEIDCLKLDMSFVRGIGDLKINAIIAAIASMAKEMRLALVAEGIENKQQASFLRTVGCGIGQGYLFSPAMSAEAVSQFLIDGYAQLPKTNNFSVIDLPNVMGSPR